MPPRGLPCSMRALRKIPGASASPLPAPGELPLPVCLLPRCAGGLGDPLLFPPAAQLWLPPRGRTPKPGWVQGLAQLPARTRVCRSRWPLERLEGPGRKAVPGFGGVSAHSHGCGDNGAGKREGFQLNFNPGMFLLCCDCIKDMLFFFILLVLPALKRDPLAKPLSCTATSQRKTQREGLA